MQTQNPTTRWHFSKSIPIVLGTIGGFILISVFDFYLLNTLTTIDIKTGRIDRAFELEDRYSMFRNIGFLGTWFAIAIGFGLHDFGSNRVFYRAIPIFLSPLTSGICAELLKLIFCRERPVCDSVIQRGGYHFRYPFSGFFDGSNLGLPSSHTAVAFGGCIILGYIFPKMQILLLALAIGCGYTRIASGAHFASDVFLGGLVGYCIAIYIGKQFVESSRKEINLTYRRRFLP